jgi:hypothetical protein
MCVKTENAHITSTLASARSNTSLRCCCQVTRHGGDGCRVSMSARVVEHRRRDVDAHVVPAGKRGNDVHGQPAGTAAQIHERVGGPQLLHAQQPEFLAADEVEVAGTDRRARRHHAALRVVEPLVDVAAGRRVVRRERALQFGAHPPRQHAHRARRQPPCPVNRAPGHRGEDPPRRLTPSR